ncbi:class I SAM-dependent methyltransferase [Puniceicoccaceae bacterium K14]|nr:class I SAM-dependent methyltransferase [Puniceicoccaceae bacterium K14]
MDIDYWDKICKNYCSEILSVYDDDLQGIVKQRIKEAGAAFSSARVADLGCGVGRFTPLLANSFGEVDACDFSIVGLGKAKRRCRGLGNVNFHQVDLSRDVLPFEPVDFAFCANVLIMPTLDKRLRAWRSVCSQVARGGSLLLVVPSMESAQMEFYDSIESHLSDGYGCSEAVRLSIEEKATTADLRLGIYQLDGVKTKHYLREELKQMLEVREFEVKSIEKVKYPTEGYGNLFRWDWLVSAVRK